MSDTPGTGQPGSDWPPPSRPSVRPTSDRTLRRSTQDRVIGGVAGGLGRYLDIDPVLIRVAFVVLALVGGSGVLAYLIAWLVIPEERPGDQAGRTDRAGPHGRDAGSPGSGAAGGAGSALFGVLLVVVGAALLLDQVLPGFRSVLGPLLLITIGVVVLARVWR